MMFVRGYGLKTILLGLGVMLLPLMGCTGQEKEAEETVESSSDDSGDDSMNNIDNDAATPESGTPESGEKEASLNHATGTTPSNNLDLALSNSSHASGQGTESESSPMTEGNSTAMAPTVNENLSIEQAKVATLPATGGGMIMGQAGVSAGTLLPEMGSKMPYIVAKGDTLGKISQTIFGNRKHWKQIAHWSGITNPNKIYPGEVIYYQLSKETLAFATKYESTKKIVVTVKDGETIRDIAQKVYGTQQAWQLVWRQNSHLPNPDALKKGMKLYFSMDTFPGNHAAEKQVSDLFIQQKAQTGLNKLQTVDENSSTPMPVYKAKMLNKHKNGITNGMAYRA